MEPASTAPNAAPWPYLTGVERGRGDLLHVGNLHAVRPAADTTLCGRAAGREGPVRVLTAVTFAAMLGRAPRTVCPACRRAAGTG